MLTAKESRILDAVHTDLSRVIRRAAETEGPKFRVLEGLRTLDRQKRLVAEGKSKTYRSRHLTGHAVDLAPVIRGKVNWQWEHFYPLAAHIKRCARDLGVRLEWGGDWQSFPDGPHWQLPRSKYP